MALKKLFLGTLNLNNDNPESGFVTTETNVWRLAEKDLTLQPKLQEDGSVLLFQRYKHRKITIKGFVRDVDSDAFEEQLDKLKIQGLNNEIDLLVRYAGRDITYKVVIQSFRPERKHLPNFSTYKLILIAPNPTATGLTHTHPVNTDQFSVDYQPPVLTRLSVVFNSRDTIDPRQTYFIRPIITFEIADDSSNGGSPAMTHVVVRDPISERKIEIPVIVDPFSTLPNVSFIRPTLSPFNDGVLDRARFLTIDCKDRIILRGNPDDTGGLAALDEAYGSGDFLRFSPVSNQQTLEFSFLPAGAAGTIRYRITFDEEYA